MKKSLCWIGFIAIVIMMVAAWSYDVPTKGRWKLDYVEDPTGGIRGEVERWVTTKDFSNSPWWVRVGQEYAFFTGIAGILLLAGALPSRRSSSDSMGLSREIQTVGNSYEDIVEHAMSDEIEQMLSDDKNVRERANWYLANFDKSVIREMADRVATEIENSKGEKRRYAVEASHYIKLALDEGNISDDSS